MKSPACDRQTLTGHCCSLHGCRDLLDQLWSNLGRLVSGGLMLNQPHRRQGVGSKRMEVNRYQPHQQV